MSSQSGRVSKGMLWTGRVVSALPALLLLMASCIFLSGNEKALKDVKKYGYPSSALMPLGAATLASVILYVIPQTAVLGAILMTGYLGGAVATHVRAGEPMFWGPILVGAFVWLGLLMREPRLRALLPFRR